jgi:membrane-associated phospholipid phosphatase
MSSSLTPAPVRVARFWPLVSAGLALLLVGGLAALIVYREQNKPFGFELEWMGELVENRSGFLTGAALVFNYLGGGIFAFILPALIAVAFVLWKRPWAALYFVIGTVASAALVKVLKQVIGRPRPEDILVTPDFGSFPSGHSANAALIATALGIVFLRGWVWAAGAVYTVAMMLSRTYLGAHWISDTVGGMLVGAGVAVIVWAPLALKLHHERLAQHPPPWSRRRRSPAATRAV